MKIVAAAILHEGKPWTGLRHHLIMRDMVEKLGDSICPIDGPQGFVTDDGKYVDRITAAKIAFAAGQIPAPKRELFSEDIFRSVT